MYLVNKWWGFIKYTFLRLCDKLVEFSPYRVLCRFSAGFLIRRLGRSLALLTTASCVLLDSNFLCNSSVSESDALSA
jgi:hypothetical protein